MRSVPLVLCIISIMSSAFAQDSEKADSMNFHCTVLYPETAGEPEISVKNDTVKFTVYYVDNACRDFTYRFSKEDNTLLVQRASSSPDSCSNEEQMLYGVEGFIANVPKGKYLFDLQTGFTDKHLESIFREVVVVKK